MGWGSFIFKEKLKRLKLRLKVWNRECFGILDQKIQVAHDEIYALDMLDDSSGLSTEDAIHRNEISAQLLQHLHNRKSLLTQKAKLSWLKNDDVNNKIFHKAIKARCLSNGFSGLEIEGAWTEDPMKIKPAIAEHFS